MMLEKRTTEFLAELSSASPVPGGGGASAAVGAFASALGMMVANLTIGKKKYAEYEEEILAARSELARLQDELVRLTDEDAKAFEPLSRAYGLPKDTEEQRVEKERVMEQALYEASLAPLQIMETIAKAADILDVLEKKGSRLAVSDVGVGILFAQAALEGASLNIFINTKMMKNRERAEELNVRAEALIDGGRRKKEAIYGAVLEKIK